MSGGANVVWHEVECGAYEADLELWDELATQGGGPVLDLGCGSGRVSLHLARRGHAVHGLDSDSELVAALEARAAAAGLEVAATTADARAFSLDTRFGTVLAPMQLLQMLAGSEERTACFGAAREHLRPGGTMAAAIVDGFPRELYEEASSSPLPDTREVGGWIYSSLPLDAGVEGRSISIRRLRQTVSPAGELSEELDEVAIQILDAGTLESEARAAGLWPRERMEIAPTDAHVGSTVVVLENRP